MKNSQLFQVFHPYFSGFSWRYSSGIMAWRGRRLTGCSVRSKGSCNSLCCTSKSFLERAGFWRGVVPIIIGTWDGLSCVPQWMILAQSLNCGTEIDSLCLENNLPQIMSTLFSSPFLLDDPVEFSAFFRAHLSHHCYGVQLSLPIVEFQSQPHSCPALP